MQPVDYQRGLVNRYYELNHLQQQLRKDMNRALSARDMDLYHDQYRQWLNVIRQMYQYKMPVSQTMEQTLHAAGEPRPGPP